MDRKKNAVVDKRTSDALSLLYVSSKLRAIWRKATKPMSSITSIAVSNLATPLLSFQIDAPSAIETNFYGYNYRPSGCSKEVSYYVNGLITKLIDNGITRHS